MEEKGQRNEQVFTPGQVVADRYEIVAQLGTGGMGSVYLANDRLLKNKPIAMKILHRNQMKDRRQLKRFMREVQLTRKINHKNIVEPYDVGVEEEMVYFTMEYVSGKNLEELIERGIKKDDIANIITQICEGLEAVHSAGVIHRDLKPGNIIVQDSGGLKITDFGVARPEVSDLTAHDEIVGSVYYMAPELWLGKKLSHSIDLYSLGVMLYEMCTGEVPFDADSPGSLMRLHLESSPVPPRELNPSVPPWLNKLVLKLLEKSPADRPRNAREVIEYVRMHTGQTESTKKESVSKSVSEDFISSLEESSKKATKLRTPPQAAQAKPAVRRPAILSGLSKLMKGSKDALLPFAHRLLLAWAAFAASVGLAIGLCAALSAVVAFPRFGSPEFAGITIGEALKISVVYGICLVLALSTPAVLLGASSGSWKSAVSAYLLFLLYQTVSAISLFVSSLYPALNRTEFQNSALLNAALEVRIYLPGMSLLSPVYTLDGVWVKGILTSPLHSIFFLLAVLIIWFCIRAALSRSLAYRGADHWFIAAMLLALVAAESLILDGSPLAVSSLPGPLREDLLRSPVFSAIFLNWVFLSLAVAFASLARGFTVIEKKL